MVEQTKTKKFHDITQNQQIGELWWDYILVNNHNFENFRNFLVNVKVYQNMLFIIEIIQYKHAVLKRLDLDENDLMIDIDNEIMEKSYIVNQIDTDNIDAITANRIRNDIGSLYTKYMLKKHEYEYNELFVTFVSNVDILLIEKRLKQIKDFDILDVLNIFDHVIDKTNSILQLLYRECVIHHLSTN